MWLGICEGHSWKDLCVPRNSNKNFSEQKLDLFHDLRGKADKEINTSITNYTIQLEQVEKKIAVCTDLRKKAQKIPQLTNIRNEIRKKILIPTYRIEAELSRIYQRLTGEVDIFRVPSILTEENDFALFFELQQMLPKAREADKLHDEFIELVKQHDDMQSTLSVDAEQQSLAALKIAISTANNSDRFFNSSNHIARYLEELSIEKGRIKRELGRLKSWLKYCEDAKAQQSRKSKSKNSNYSKNSENNKKSYAQVKTKMESGEGLSIAELNILLNNGGLFSKEKPKDKSSPKNKYSRSKKKNNTNDLSAHRGSRGRSKNVHKE